MSKYSLNTSVSIFTIGEMSICGEFVSRIRAMRGVGKCWREMLGSYVQIRKWPQPFGCGLEPIDLPKIMTLALAALRSFDKLRV